MRVDSDDGDASRLIHEISHHVIAHGGFIREDLVVHQQGSELWTSVSGGHLGPRATGRFPVADHLTLLSLPGILLVPVSEIQWRESRDQLAYVDAPKGLSGVQRSLLDAMVDLFNICHKVQWASRHFLTSDDMNDAKLFELIREARPRWKASVAASPAHAFLKSRVLTALSPTAGKQVDYLLPMIDMLNHHPDAFPYEMTSRGELQVRVSHSGEGDEAFVRYRQADALGLALGLGYFEAATRFVTSVDCEIDLKGFGRVQIAGTGAPPRVGDVPSIVGNSDGLMILGLVLRPSDVGRLRVLLGMALRAYDPTFSRQRAEDLAAALLDAAAVANIGYFRRLWLLAREPSGPASTRELRGVLASVSLHQCALLEEVRSLARQ